MKNIKELRNELADNFERLKGGNMEVKEASELNNTAGKMIQTLMVELKEQEITGSKKGIPFLGYEGKEQLPANGVKQIHE